MNKATLYGVGIGPGDPELITLRALRILERCPVIAVPETPRGGTLALDILSQVVTLRDKRVVHLPFAMTRDREAMARCHQAAVRQLCQLLSEGGDVAVPNLGDVSIYATFGYLIEPVQQAGYPVQLIPGVPSFCAVAAALGISLTEANQPLHLLPGGGEGLQDALRLPGTKVLMKSGRQLPAVKTALREAGVAGRAMFVQNCGLPDERIGWSADAMSDDLGYFTTIVVKG